MRLRKGVSRNGAGGSSPSGFAGQRPHNVESDAATPSGPMARIRPSALMETGLVRARRVRAHAVDARLVVEHIQLQDSLDALGRLRVDSMQGFIVSKPVRFESTRQPTFHLNRCRRKLSAV